MYKVLIVQIFLLHILISAEKIKTLENEKMLLLKEINKAIDDSVKVLNDVNDTESKQGVSYLTKLKEQLKEINETAYENIKTNDTRRSDLFKLDVYDLAEVYKKNKNTKKKIEEEANKLTVKQKIQQWILEREQEKKKIKEYSDKQKHFVPVEKCPREGLGSETSKNRRSGGGKDQGSRKKYPCCRKCCKKSYMGCL